VTTPDAPDGVLLIDKPSGMTSHDVVDAVRRSLGTRKVGHAGTLDPMATGLLVLGVGRATRLLRFLGGLPKTYEGTIRLGIETDTLDAEGEVVRTTDVRADAEAIRAAMAALVGTSLQRPPAYSAVKVGGRKLYEAARAGETIEAEPRPIHVDAFDLLGLDGPDARFRVVCGGGTYVRVLAADVGAALGCGAHLSQLRRTAIGSLRVGDATSPEHPGPPLPMSTAVAHLPQLRLNALEAEAASHGRVLGPAGIVSTYAVTGPDGELIGIYRDEGGSAKPEMILAPSRAAGGPRG
jgi:tRNA pseudouridine55 synthase